VNDWLQYGALGLLALVLVSMAGFAYKLALPLWQDSIATNRELRDLARSLRETLAAMGARHTVMAEDLREVHEMVEDLHHQQFGTKRTSQIVRERHG